MPYFKKRGEKGGEKGGKKGGKKGGQILGKGANGCIVSPNYKCTADTKVSRYKISKVATTGIGEHDLANEIKFKDKIRNIDPSGNHFMLIDESCEFDRSKFNKDRTDERRCDGKSMYIADYIGIDVLRFIFKDIKIFNKIYLNVIIGLAKLEHNNLAHADIKTDNIAVNEHHNGIIIDFGSMRETGFKDDDMFISGTPGYIPIQNIYFMYKKFPGGFSPFIYEANIKYNYLDDYLKNYNTSLTTLITGKHIENLNETFEYSNDVKEDVNSFLRYSIDLPETDEETRAKISEQFYKTDIFSLGICMLETIQERNLFPQMDHKLRANLLKLISDMIQPDIFKRKTAHYLLHHNFYIQDNIVKKNIDTNKFFENYNNYKKLNPSNSDDEDEKSEISGGKRKSKIKKNIRKHYGVNQQTGRLKKGYKYSGKKLKNGLLQIMKTSNSSSPKL